MKAEATPATVVDSRGMNIEYLDASVTWAENLVELRTAMLYGERDEAGLAVVRAAVEAAEATMERLASSSGRGMVPAIPFEALVSRYGLCPEETAILRIAVAPALETSFRKRVARYKDNVLLDYVDVDFVLAILFQDRLARLAARDFLLPGARLVSERLVTLKLPRDATSDTFIGHEICVPDRLVNFVLGHDYLDKSIASHCTLSHPSIDPDAVVMDEKVKTEVVTLLKGWLGRQAGDGSRRGMVFGLSGAPGCGKTMFAAMLASIAGRPLITVDSAKLGVDDTGFKDTLDAIFLDAKVRDGVLVFDNCEALFSQKNPRIPSVYAQLERHDGIACILTSDPRQLDASLERYIAYQVEFEHPDIPQRERLWRLHLDGRIGGGGGGGNQGSDSIGRGYPGSCHAFRVRGRPDQERGDGRARPGRLARGERARSGGPYAGRVGPGACRHGGVLQEAQAAPHAR